MPAYLYLHFSVINNQLADRIKVWVCVLSLYLNFYVNILGLVPPKRKHKNADFTKTISPDVMCP